MVALTGRSPARTHCSRYETGICRARIQEKPCRIGDKGMKDDVFVNAYERIRFGRVEHVCAHWRSRPT